MQATNQSAAQTALGITTATTSTAGLVPGLGGTAIGNAATVGQVFSPPVDDIIPAYQYNYKRVDNSLGVILGHGYMAGTNFIAESGRMYFSALKGVAGCTVSAISFSSSTGATGLTLCRGAIYEADFWPTGNASGQFSSSNSRLVASTASITSVGNNVNISLSLTVPLVLDPEKRYYVGLLQVGTTPALLRGIAIPDGYAAVAHPHSAFSRGTLSDIPSDLANVSSGGAGTPICRFIL